MTENARSASEYRIWYHLLVSFPVHELTQPLPTQFYHSFKIIRVLQGRYYWIKYCLYSSLCVIELCYCISEDPFFESFSLSKSKTAAVLTPTIQKVEDEECQESDIFSKFLLFLLIHKLLAWIQKAKDMTSWNYLCEDTDMWDIVFSIGFL